MFFLLNCLKSYPPQRVFDHATELEHGARPPAQALYRMAPAELVELRKQLDWLLEARLIQSSKAPYGSPVLFQRKQNGSMKMCVDYRALNKKLREYELYAKKEKCKFCCEQITFLGHVINQGKIQMDRKKAISSQPVLRLPQFDKSFEVKVDASDRALGGVLV
ncbi:UNVERIFIED_CONTAM: Transposon Ty3-G Gag-Pol polyprotein [Sesamum radiatum]|uniref:Transposon Ty3-G Gag-Pol polyprotein n=1 Tax=Sesamum radiatum TaxID=300843 RepID=A0AAW2P0H5_SESRA